MKMDKNIEERIKRIKSKNDASEEIKKAAKEANVPLWKVAYVLELHPTTLSSKLHLLTDAQKEEILAIIEALKE